jgi:hypothetical protein
VKNEIISSEIVSYAGAVKRSNYDLVLYISSVGITGRFVGVNLRSVLMETGV